MPGFILLAASGDTKTIGVLLLMFGVATLVSYFFYLLGIPNVIGYLVTGIILSPSTTGLLAGFDVSTLSEIGVILLLFTIGLEFNFSKLLTIKNYVFVGGGVQVGVTILVVCLINYLTRYDFATSLFWGFLISLSSTAIVIKRLQDQMEIMKDYGKLSLAILLFQDIIVVPMLLIIPMLTGEHPNLLMDASIMIGKFVALGVVAVLLTKYIMPPLLDLLGKMNNQEVFIIGTLAIVSAITYLTAELGLSPALGAFIGGLIIAETDYNRLTISCVMPFRYVFLSFFFISMGMLLDYRIFITDWDQILIYLGMSLFVKLFTGFLAAKAVNLNNTTAWMTGFSLAQIGEFSFVLAQTGVNNQIINQTEYQVFIAISLVTMILAPILIAWKNKIIPQAGKLEVHAS